MKGEVLKVVPSTRGDPVVLGFVGLGSDESSRVGDTESADSADISEEGLIHSAGNKSVAGVLLKVIGLWEENGVWDFEGFGVIRGRARSGAARDEN